jgi:hypothetical protein
MVMDTTLKVSHQMHGVWIGRKDSAFGSPPERVWVGNEQIDALIAVLQKTKATHVGIVEVA